MTIANNKNGTITVTNKAKRVYGDFQVTKVLAAGSTADASNTYSGDWSCTLGAETRTGTWGPIAGRRDLEFLWFRPDPVGCKLHGDR